MEHNDTAKCAYYKFLIKTIGYDHFFVNNETTKWSCSLHQEFGIEYFHTFINFHKKIIVSLKNENLVQIVWKNYYHVGPNPEIYVWTYLSENSDESVLIFASSHSKEMCGPVVQVAVPSRYQIFLYKICSLGYEYWETLLGLIKQAEILSQLLRSGWYYTTLYILFL